MSKLALAAACICTLETQKRWRNCCWRTRLAARGKKKWGDGEMQENVYINVNILYIYTASFVYVYYYIYDIFSKTEMAGRVFCSKIRYCYNVIWKNLRCWLVGKSAKVCLFLFFFNGNMFLWKIRCFSPTHRLESFLDFFSRGARSINGNDMKGRFFLWNKLV